jgi:superoxide dismutase, Cu-Zn family
MKKGLIGAACAIFAVGCGTATENHAEAQRQGETSGGEGLIIKDPGENPSERAVAIIEPRSGSTLRGTATFVEKDGKVTLIVEVEGGKAGPHGIHLHEKGDCSAPDATSAGGHWNPTGEQHGKISHTPQAHSGDMGNIVIGEDGRGRLEFTSDRWSINKDPNTNVVGKAIVIHDKEDDLKTQPTGDAGDRIGCGVVTIP